MDEISYTLRIAIDDLQNRLSNNSQNVTTYDHLINFGINDSTNSDDIEKPFEEFKEHYAQIFETLKNIQSDVSFIEIQLKNIYNEHLNSSLQKSRWILNKGCELKNIFADTMTRFKLIQQNHLHSLRTKHHHLEQQSWGIEGSVETKEKQKIIAKCIEKVQDELNDNEYRVNELKEMFVQSVVIEDPLPTAQVQFENIEIHNTQTQGATETYESASRKQKLWLIIFAALVLVIFAILLLNFV